MAILLILVGILVAVIVFIKLTNKGQNVWSYFIVVLAIFLLATLLYATTLPNVDLSSLDGIVNFGKIYLSWVMKLGGNAAHITGDAVKLDWGLNLNNTGR